MRNQTSRCSDYDGCSLTQRVELLIVSVAIVSSIYSHRTDAVKIISKALHSLVYLLGKFTRRAHDETVDGILWESLVMCVESIVKKGEDREQISRCLASACLRYAHYVVTLEYRLYGSLLDRSTLFESHVIKSIENVVV